MRGGFSVAGVFPPSKKERKNIMKVMLAGGEMGAEVKCFSKSRAVVQEITQRVSGSARVFVFHRLLRADGETSVKAGKVSGDNKMRNMVSA